VLSVRPVLPGQVQPVPVAQPAFATKPQAPRLLILIHGFNTTEAEAEERYRKFQDELSGALAGRLGLVGEVWEFHWPGNHPIPEMSDLSYGPRVPIATLSGRELADYLAGLGSHQAVNIVAHSLGCRVALAAIQEIRRMHDNGAYNGATIGQVFLMAAAVPVLFCQATREFPTPAPGSSEHVLYSRRDLILLAGFRLGQRDLGEPGNAVGRNGEPIYRWSTRSDMRIDHGDYWTASRVARIIGAIFKPGTWRSLPQQGLPRADGGLWIRSTPVQYLPSSTVERRRPS
jgi:pimeloyl-ACP methyl ester carboxylesterase